MHDNQIIIPKYIYYTNFQMIYFGDPQLVEKHLHNDLNTIIKNVKNRQDQYLQLLEYNRSILIKKRNIQTTIFINDQITLHKTFFKNVQQTNVEILKQEKQIEEKYEQASVKFQPVIKLMARVSARILQTFQTYIDKIKVYEEGIVEQYNKMKTNLTKLVNQKESLQLGQAMHTIIYYSKAKVVHQIQKLKLLIKGLQQGQVQKLQYIYKGIQKKQPIPQKPKIVQKIQPPTILKPQPKKQQQNDKIHKLKQEIKKQQKNKKQKQKLATKMIYGLYSTMDLSRKQFMDDLVYTDPNTKYKQIYNAIFSRNKLNLEQITQFQSKKSQFEEKVKIFKQNMLLESQKIQQVLMIRKPVKHDKLFGQNSQSMTNLHMQNQQDKNPQNNQQVPSRQQGKNYIIRQKACSPRFHKQAEFINLRTTQQGFTHIKFDTTNHQTFLRSNRARLPQILQKGTAFGNNSVDHRYNNGKIKEQKTPRKNIVMKNIEVGVQSVIQNQNRNKSQSRQVAQKMKEIQGINATMGIGVSLGMDFTFYTKKKAHILNDSKNNIAF